MKYVPPLERLTECSIPEPNSGCWLWLGTTNDDGYGRMTIRRKAIGAHRISFELLCHPIPKGMHVLHKCDVRSCVNPDHLFLGTNLDNMADKMAKGREAKGPNHKVKGEGNGNAKLSDWQVLEIKESGLSQRKIAAKYGICQAVVSEIKTGKMWSHITRPIERHRDVI